MRARFASVLSRRRPDLLAGAFVAAASLTIVFFVMRLWRADLGIPFVYEGDANLFLMLLKGIDSHGWYFSNPDLGAPFGQENYDFPVVSGDAIHVLLFKLLSLVGGDYVTALNLFFLLGFALAGISAFAVFRLLGVGRAPAIACSILFTLLPYHFVVGESQPFHSAFWVVPLACYLVFAVLQGRPLLEPAEGRRGVLRYASRTTAVTLGLCLVVGSAGVNYYAVFAAILVAAVAPLAALRARELRPLLTGAIVSAAIFAAVGLNALPTLIYRLDHGSNPEVAHRTEAENVSYSLNIGELALPIAGHRLKPLAELRERYETESPLPFAAAGPALGAVATAGFLWLLGVAVASLAGAVPRRSPWSTHRDAAGANLISLLIATTAGFSILIAYLVSPQLRVWERYYLFIAFFSLLAVGLLLGRGLEWLEARNGRRGAYFGVAAMAGVVAVGVLDQTSNSDPAYVPPYSKTAAEWRSDERFVSDIESRLPPGSDLYQLPYVAYPEAQRSSRTRDFDPVRPYLHSSDLRWSYGAMLNRPEDWQAALMDKPFALVPPSLAAAGFEGVVVDRLAYPDDGARVERVLGRTLGAQPLASPNGRFSFFDMRPYRRRLSRTLAPGELPAVREATLHPLRTRNGDALPRFTIPGEGATGAFQLAEPTATLELENPAESERTAMLSIKLDGEAAVQLELPGGATRTLRAGEPVLEPVSLPPGVSSVALTLADPGAPGQPVVIRTELRDAALAPISRGRPPRPEPPAPTLFGGDPTAAPSAPPAQPSGPPPST